MLIVDSAKQNSELLDLASEAERETARTLVSRLQLELGFSCPRGIGSLRRKHAHRRIIATAKEFSCGACEESQERRLHAVAAQVLHELGTCLEVDQFEWKHPVLKLHVLGTIMVDAGCRAASVTIQRVMDTEHGLGDVTSEIMLNTLLNHWIKYCGKPNIIRTDLEGAFRDQGFRRGLAAKSIRLDIDLGDASWKTGVLGKTLDVWLEELLTVSQLKKSLMSALRLASKSRILSVAAAAGKTSRFFGSCSVKLWTRLQSSVFE